MDYDEYDYLEQKQKEYEKWVKEKSIRLELGKIYLQAAFPWAEKHYKIVSIDGDVALGKVVYCGIYKSRTMGCGEYEMFKVNTGEKYHDSRLNYALVKEI